MGSKNGHAWLCATRLGGTCMQLVGKGGGGVREEVICGCQNFGRRLQTNIWYAEKMWFGELLCFKLNRGLRGLCKKGSGDVFKNI